MEEDTFINILLLGETGVGKSTFINSFVNYLTYRDFNIAKKGNLTTLIPSKIQIQDKHGEYHTIEIGSKYDTNECLKTGMSATQDVKSYVFSIRNDAEMKIRLIDTPGIGDVRGIKQDNINCEKIVRFIKHFKKLHAICYLLKPTNSRITIYFDYCMTQILSRLEKSASKNIIFIFTNSRGTDYTPGDTLVNLEKIINDIKSSQDVKIPLDKNVFCFDNEPFRCLAAFKENVQFDRSVRQRNYESWKQSAKQCNDLIKYIIGYEKHAPLLPHFVEITCNINEVKRFIALLSEPLAGISQLINNNLLAIQRHEENIELESDTLNELKQNLYTSITDLQQIKLYRNSIVCASRKCAEKYKVGDVHKIHYTQVCQDFCYDNIPKDIIGCPQILSSSVIDSSTQTCKTCNCDFSAHICIDYRTITVKSKSVDSTVNESIKSRENILHGAKQAKIIIDVQNDELERERDTILRTCTRFAHFLKNNVILPFSKSYKGYIEYLIMQEKSLGVSSDKSVVECLHKLLQEYEAAKQSFDKALTFHEIDGSDVLKTPYSIEDSLKDLYKLKHNGAKIKDLYGCFKKFDGIQFNYTEYVHETILRIHQKRYPNEGIHKSTSNNNFINQQQKQYRSNEQSQNQSYETYHSQNNQSNRFHRGRGRFQNRARGRGQWQHRGRGRNRSQNYSSSKSGDSESEQSQSSDTSSSSESSGSDQTEISQSRESHQHYRQFISGDGERDRWNFEQRDESVSRTSSRSRYSESDQSEQRGYQQNQPRYQGKWRGQRQHHSRRNNSHGYNKREQSQSPNRQYNQSYHQSRYENGERGQWKGHGKGRDQSQSQFEPRDRKDESNKPKTSSRGGDSEKDETENCEQKVYERNPASYRGGRRNQHQNQGRTRGQWQYRGRGNSKMQNRNRSQSPTGEGNQTHDQSRFQNRGRGQGRARNHSQAQFRSRNPFRNQKSENNQLHTPDSPTVKENPQTSESDFLTQFSLGTFSGIPDRKSTNQSQNQNKESARSHSSLSRGINTETLNTSNPFLVRQDNKNESSSFTVKNNSEEKELRNQPRSVGMTGQSHGLRQQSPTNSTASFARPRTVVGPSTQSTTSSPGMQQFASQRLTANRTSFGGTQNRARGSMTTSSNARMSSQNRYPSFSQPSKPVKKKDDCTIL